MKLSTPLLALAAVAMALPFSARSAEDGLSLARDKNWLVIKGAQIPGGEVRINYLEAYCRPGSTDADWVKHTVIPHKDEMVSLDDQGHVMKLKDVLEDGVVVEHTITAAGD